MSSIKTYGAINVKRKQFYPCANWNMDKLIVEIKESKIKLIKDYSVWGRSFDGVDYRFLHLVKKNYIKDYNKILEYFPLLELELLRHEQYNTDLNS
jgi:hypothetical protein